MSGAFGLLNVDKPPGMTSRDVVNRVQRLVRGLKVGHAGTLDPLASGVLVLCLGPATRLVEYIQRMPKRYAGMFLLGRTSDTEDIEGRVTELANPPRPTHAQIEAVLGRFTGPIEQRPPAFSALKIGGRRAYELARQGKPVELEARRIVIHSIRVVRYAYPELELDVTCGAGTYLRSLGRDIAAALGTGAVMASLRRTAVGAFRADDACRLDQLDEATVMRFLLPPAQALAELPSIRLDAADIGRLAKGLAIEDRWATAAPEIAGLDAAGRLAAILGPRGKRHLRPLRNFPIHLE